jgi:hypothetical protein
MPDPVPLAVFSFADFSGGLCNRTSPLLLKPNQAWRLLNMKFITDNLMEKRPGTHPIDDLVLTKPIKYMDIYKPINKPEELIRATEDEVYADTTKICDVNGVIQGINYIGNYYFLDGKKLRQYDGTNVYEIVEPPHSYLSADIASGATTAVLKDWDARISIGDKIQIEALTTYVGTISDINETTKTVTFTPATTSDFTADTYVRLYTPKDESNVEGVWQTDETLKLKWYEPCDQELNDVFKGECYLNNHCTSIAIDSERMYIAGDKDNPHEIYISDINNPFYFPVELGMQCAPNGDKIIDIMQFDDAIVVGRNEDVHVISGETNNDSMANFFVLTKFDTHTGFASKNNARLVNDYLFYLGSDMNVYAMHTTQYNSTSKATVWINKDTIDLKLAPLSFSYDDIKDAPAVFFEDEYYIIIKDKVLVYNYNNKAFTVYSGMNASYMIVKEGQLLIGTTTGKVMYLGGAWNDDGKAIECYYQTGNNDFGYPVNFKDFVDMYAQTYIFAERDSSIILTALVDWNEVDTEFDIQDKISRFGVAKFGEPLISRNIAQTDDIAIDARGREFGFIFSNNELDEPLRVYKISGTYKLRNMR